MSYGKVNKTTGERIPYAGNGSAGIDTTYTLSVGTGADADKIVLTPSTGNPDKVTVPYATNSGTVNGKTVAENVPSGAVFTDTTDADDLNYDNTDSGLSATKVQGAIDEVNSKVGDLRSDVKLNTQDLTTTSRTKNILPLTVERIKAVNADRTWSGNACTVDGVTFTILTDDDGSVVGISTSGTAKSTIYIDITGEIIPSSYNGKLLTGCPANGSLSTYRLLCVESGVARAGDIGSGATISGMSANGNIQIRINSGTDMTGKVFYPMIRNSSDNATFEPYIPSVETRLEDAEYYQKQNDLNLEVTNRKNIIAMTLEVLKSLNTNGTWSGNAYTHNGITYTVQTNASNNITGINANGTASNNSELRLANMTWDGNSYILNGCPSGGSSTTFRVEVQNNNPCYGDEVVVRPDAGAVRYVRIYVNSGASVSNKVFYPMVRPTWITDGTFAPYVPSVESRIEAVESDLTGVFKADLLYEGAPTTAETYEEMNLISGKSITDYLLILFVCRQYNNTVAFAIEPRHVFTQQTGDSSRVIFKYGDGALQTVMVYYVSPTKIAVYQKTVDGTVWKTALYGIIKQP